VGEPILSRPVGFNRFARRRSTWFPLNGAKRSDRSVTTRKLLLGGRPLNSQAALQVATVIGALYDQSQPAQQQEANTWLMAFTASPGAWEVAVNLLGAGASTEVREWAHVRASHQPSAACTNVSRLP
jgi:hypothetical protein